jgi:hypothetical protein
MLTVAGAAPLAGLTESQLPPVSVRTAVVNGPGIASLDTVYVCGINEAGQGLVNSWQQARTALTKGLALTVSATAMRVGSDDLNGDGSGVTVIHPR